MGEIVEATLGGHQEMRLNDAGRMIEQWWLALNNKYPHVQMDASVVMPNHVHGIMTINQGAHAGAPLPEIVQWFKTMTTNEYIRGVKQLRWPPFQGKLWQRNYYEHIIRNEDELNRIRQYIEENPVKWEMDPENPAVRMTKSRGCVVDD